MSNVDVLLEVIKKYSKPVIFFLIGEKKEVEFVGNKLSENNIPSFSNLESIVKNFWVLLDESRTNSQQ
jgi:hypothetical protein